ncbi:MAG: cohesin domain-containing protein [Terriglobales bacterium]
MSVSPARLRLCMVLLALCIVAGSVHLYAGDKGEPYYRHGELSMAHHNYDQAYVDFRKAMELSPNNITYQIATHRAQFAAANEHIQQGEKLKAAKNYGGALKQFQFAAVIDPANFIAGQEITAVDNILHPPPPPPGESVSEAETNTLAARLARAAGPVSLEPIANSVVSDFTVNSGPKDAYRAAAKLAGLNVIFDNSAQGGYANSARVSLNLHNVSVMQILRVLNIETNSFYIPVTPNTILVATDNRTNHQQVDPTVLKVFYIKNIQNPTDLTELASAIRGLMQPQPHIMPVASIDALVMRDTPDKVAMVQRVLDDLDKEPPEVVVNVRILQVNREVTRDLGLLPPTSFGIGLQTTTPSTTTPSTSSTGSTTTPAATSTTPTLNSLKHLNSGSYAITIPNATLSALLNNTNTQTIQEPTLRAVQGQKATLQIGEKIPIATGSFQPGIGGVGINPLVNTQFQYQQVGVIINMTPQIHGDQSVLLKEDITLSSVVSYTDIGGIQQPIIGNNEINHTIEVNNNQSVVLGGLIVNTETHNTSGIPGLSSIPLLRYLFSSEHNDNVQQEVLIVLTPHIVHSLSLSPADMRSLDTGTQDNVHLRILPPASAATTTSGASSSGSLSAGASFPGSGATPAVPAANAPALVFSPAQVNTQAGRTFEVQMAVQNATDAYAYTFQLNFNPKVLQLVSMRLGRFLQAGGRPPAMVYRQDAVAGTAQVSLSRPAGAPGLSGGGHLITMTFRALARGTSPLTVSRVGARSAKGAPQALATGSGSVVVQ